MYRVFMAEDNPADVYMLKLALRESGADFELEVAWTGKEALAFLRKEIDSGNPQLALIVLDLNLPYHDGTDILRYVRCAPSLSSVPTVMFSSSDSPRDRQNAIREGASCFIRKPSLLTEYMAVGTTLKEMLEGDVTQALPSLP